MSKSPALGKSILGKGVGALIQAKTASTATISNKKRSQNYEVVDIEINKISVNPLQPRKEFDPIRLNELKESIQKYGLMNPITVKETTGGYEIVAGERRFRAFQLAQTETIPAIITSISSNAEQLEKALIENIQREDLNPIEIANSYRQLIEEFSYTQEQLAERIGKERSSVTNILRILKLPDTVQDLVIQKKISLGHAKVLLGLDDSSQIIAIAKDIVDKGLSVRATEKIINDIKYEKIIISKDSKTKVAVPKQSSLLTEEQLIIEDIQNRLRTIYGTNVKIFTKSNQRGTIEIEFYSNDDFERIVEILES
jgi:ParB family chromosome partitioning protein